MVRLPLCKSLAARDLLLDYVLCGTSSTRYEYYQRELGNSLPIDIQVLGKALQILEKSNNEEVELQSHESGTALRFLVALCAAGHSPVLIKRSPRLAERPLEPLLQLFREMGATFTPIGNDLFITPVKTRIYPKLIDTTLWESSQFASAILLTAPLLEWKTLQMHYSSNSTSFSYLQMTLATLQARGIHYTDQEGVIRLTDITPTPTKIELESDWSAASNFYLLLLLQPQLKSFQLSHLRLSSTQPDVAVAHFFSPLGITTKETPAGVVIHYEETKLPSRLELDLSQNLDLFPVLAIALTIKGIPFTFSGVAPLRLKESDRLKAVQEGLEALGFTGFQYHHHTFQWTGNLSTPPLPKGVLINTYNDHRITMAFAVLDKAKSLALRFTHPESVQKSFPHFWQELDKAVAP